MSDFARFRLHDLVTGDTREFALKDLHKHIRHFGFIAGYETQTIKPQNPVNIQAAERVAFLFQRYQALTSLLPAEEPAKRRGKSTKATA